MYIKILNNILILTISLIFQLIYRLTLVLASDSLQKSNHGTTSIHYQQHNCHPPIYHHDTTPICHIKPLAPPNHETHRGLIQGKREKKRKGREIRERQKRKRSTQATRPTPPQPSTYAATPPTHTTRSTPPHHLTHVV